jgi:tRNA(Ile)-lysidine synthase
MLTKVYKFITDNKMVTQGDTVVCGLSGGADSVALLICMCELSQKLHINVEALHVNHCLRGAESDSDQQFCQELCKKLDVPFKAVSCDVSSYAVQHSLSTEEAARVLRYDIFKEYSEGKRLATAHNANDNLETVILNLARGTGIKGLAGIPPIRGNIVRPLLTVTRQEIETFLFERSQTFVTDSTNLSDDYTRNKIRHKILPLLGEINSSAVETSVNSINTVREENAFIEELTDEAMSNCRNGDSLNGLDSYSAVIRKRCISRLLTEKGLPYSHKRLEEADNVLVNSGKINISGDVYLIGANGSLELKKISATTNEYKEIPLEIGTNRIFDNCELFCEIIECDNLKKIEAVHKKSTFYLLDYDKINGRTVLRSRKFGDKIRLSGRSFTSSVKKLINETIDAEIRPTLHFIEDEAGTVFAEGIGIADRVAPDNNTVRCLKISVNR